MERLCIGVIGLGSIGTQSLQFYLQNPAVKVTALCDIDDERIEGLARKHGLQDPLLTTDYRELASSPNVDMVSIHGSDALHGEMVLYALDHDKHVFVEKPLAHTIELNMEIRRRAMETDRQVAVGHVLRYYPHFIRIKEALDRGLLGDPFYIEADYLTDQVLRSPEVAKRAQSTYGPAILTLGIHPLDLMRWYVGRIVSVKAFSNQNLASPGSGLDECVVALYQFENGCVGRLATTWTAHPAPRPYYGLRLHGSQGTLCEDQITLAPYDKPMQLPPVPTNLPPPLKVELDDVVDAILTGRPVRCSAEDAALSTAWCLAAQEAALTGETLTEEDLLAR